MLEMMRGDALLDAFRARSSIQSDFTASVSRTGSSPRDAKRVPTGHWPREMRQKRMACDD